MRKKKKKGSNKLEADLRSNASRVAGREQKNG